MSTATIAHPLLSFLLNSTGRGWEGTGEQQQCSPPELLSLKKAGALARPQPDQLVNAELTAHMEVWQESLRAHCACTAQLK